ncbi:MAG: diguanylate cyclase [Clostridiales bacterium]|nr:diguanylate cyclase [Clostridiales bacterium]
MKKSKIFFSSLSARLIFLIVIGAFLLAITLVMISVILTNRILTENTATQMNLFCEERGDDLDTEFLRVEDAVGSLARWTRNKIPDVKKISEEGKIRDNIVKDADDLIHFMTEHNEFIQGAYIHYTLDITGVTDREEGVYYTRNGEGKFSIIPFTQKEIEEDPVAEYWYYGPIKNKKAVWTKPYYDASADDYLISYVEPVFIEDKPVAIIGIDISFSRLLKWVDSLKYQKTGYMYLKEADGSVHYHLADLGQDHLHSDEEDQITDNAELMSQPKTGDELIRYYFDGRDRAMAFVTLRNGMKFVLCDDYHSVFSARNRAINVMVWISLGMTIVLAGFAALMANRITGPLRELTSAANEISEGDYDVILPPERNDEVGELSRAFRIAIDNIRARSEDIKARIRVQEHRLEQNAQTMKQQEDDLLTMRNLAYIDSLTGVKNKHAYEDTAGYIDEQIRNGTAQFAVIMCDLNYLKLINDNRGHQAGDVALKKAAKLLCNAFPMSTVFRIGGDEFVVIPSVIEYARIDEQLDALKAMMRKQKETSEDVLDRISFAFGTAVYDREKDSSFNDVFERADQNMYEEKKKVHEADGISTGR